jgi:hypothetical protein
LLPAGGCLQETVRLHDVLEAWLVGALDRTPEVFSAFETALADPCSVVSPLGTRTEREALVAEAEGLHGVLAADRGRFAVRVRNIRGEALLGDHAVLPYEEWRERGGDRSARLVTVLMREEPSAPLGVASARIHETWLPGLAPTAGERFPE